MNKPEDIMMAARCYLYNNYPWYGHLAMNFEWQESSMSWAKTKTIGSKVTRDGVVIYYYGPWVSTLTIEKNGRSVPDNERICYAVKHVIDHLVRMHPARRFGRDNDRWNVACDMVVNGKETNPNCGKPFTDMVWMTKEFPNDASTETIYDLLEDHPEFTSLLGGDDHTQWERCECSNDEIQQIITSHVNDANSKFPGSTPGHLKSAIGELKKPLVSWRQLLRRLMGRLLGGKRMTYSRINRRHQTFGVKGISRRATTECTVIVDTSGSISENELEQFFAEIESIMHSVRVTVVLWDAALQGVIKYRKGMWRSIKVAGGGGTDMAAPLDYVIKNNLANDAVVMLTDGYVSKWPSNKNIFMIFCITTMEDGPDWGETIRLKIR